IGLVGYVAIHETPAFDRQRTWGMVKFCAPLWLAGLAGLYIGSSGAMYLRVFDTLSDVGRLELAIKFATVVSALVWTPFFQHWEPISYRIYKEPDAQRKFQVAFIGIATLMFAAGLAISIFAQPVTRIMAAKSFYPAAAIVPILTLAFILNCLRSFFNFSFLATGHTKVQSFCLNVPAVIITIAYVVLIPLFGLSGAAVAFCVTFLASFIYTRRVSRRYYDPEYNLSPIWNFAVIGAVAYICSNVLFQTRNLGIDLLIKSFVLLGASSLMGLIGIRAIRAAHASAFDALPWPLSRLGQISLIGREVP
ncbi:MAG: lipopolysaccharide biosynthesis protein, partial [Terriglobia bacterium]